MSKYVRRKTCDELPRLPLEGFLDLTYRCNNNCRHCWLWTADTAATADLELTFDEIKSIVSEARAMGCRFWAISGGEPMLRPDFEDIFDYLSGLGPYSLNTNGTLITPRIAALMKRKGSKMVALYGATADVHDNITRTPGSFDAFMRGCSLLKEAGAGFIVQLVPMKDNYFQLGKMRQLGEALSPVCRIGAAWLQLSANGNPVKNSEIVAQRLLPRQALELDLPDMSYEERKDREPACADCSSTSDDRLFAPCIATRSSFHIDPYGQASFCHSIKEASLSYDLKQGGFTEFWDIFIPSLAEKVTGGQEYRDNCGSCELKKHCRWCGVYGFLEHRRFNAKVEYLCDIAKEAEKFTEEWMKSHRRYYCCAGITIQVDSDIPIEDKTFAKALHGFEVPAPGEDIVTISHHFGTPDISNKDLGQEIYRHLPWAIYKKNDSWIYLGIFSLEKDSKPYQISLFNKDFSRGHIYHSEELIFGQGDSNSLCFFPTDQLLIARLLADRAGFYLHSSGVVYHGHGLLFVGDSGAGKSTMVQMLKDRAETLCDDRIILRKQHGQWKIHGTWSHGDVPDVSPKSAPLKAIFFLEQARENNIVVIENENERLRRLLACLIRPVIDAAWWKKTLPLIEEAGLYIPCYRMLFDKAGGVLPLIEELLAAPNKDEK